MIVKIGTRKCNAMVTYLGGGAGGFLTSLYGLT